MGSKNANTALVSNEGRLYLVSGGVRYPIDPARSQAIINVLDLSGRNVTPGQCKLAEFVHRRVNIGPAQHPQLGPPRIGNVITNHGRTGRNTDRS